MRFIKRQQESRLIIVNTLIYPLSILRWYTTSFRVTGRHLGWFQGCRNRIWRVWGRGLNRGIKGSHTCICISWKNFEFHTSIMARNASKYCWPHRIQELTLHYKTIISQYYIHFSPASLDSAHYFSSWLVLAS